MRPADDEAKAHVRRIRAARRSGRSEQGWKGKRGEADTRTASRACAEGCEGTLGESTRRTGSGAAEAAEEGLTGPRRPEDGQTTDRWVVHGLCRRDGSRPVAGAQRHNFQDVAPVIRYSLVRRLRDSNPCEFARLL